MVARVLDIVVERVDDEIEVLPLDVIVRVEDEEEADTWVEEDVPLGNVQFPYAGWLDMADNNVSEFWTPNKGSTNMRP